MLPIFADDELVAWCWAEGHIIDVGGMSPGGFAPAAHDCYSEALRFPGIKFMEKGRVLEDIKRLIDANFRLPSRNYNDLRCFLAATSVGERRVLDLIGRHGVDAFRRYVQVNNELSEQAVRERIAKLPNKTLSAEAYVEHNGHVNELFTIRCTLTIHDDSIDIDFTGTDPQTDGFVNISEGAMVGVAVTPLMLMLAPDVAFNEGFFRTLTLTLPEATLVNVRMPAPSSSGHMETGMQAMKLLTRMLSEVMQESEDTFVRSHAMAPWHDGWIGSVFAGADDSGDQFLMLDMHGGGAGGGAQTVVDGMDAAGTLTQVSNGLPDIEFNELGFPVRYLWRHLNTNCGGAGRFRGGQGIDFAWTPDGASSGQETVFAGCWQNPPPGVDGGYPGGTSGYKVIQHTNLPELTRYHKAINRESITGEVLELEGKQAGIPLVTGDVFNQFEGGGGVGDPLARDPDLVAGDVRDRYIGHDVASSVYGVVFLDDDLTIDSQATATRRDEIRKRRLAGAIKGISDVPPQFAEPTSERRIGFSLAFVTGSDGTAVYSCQHCGESLASIQTDWHDASAHRERPVDEVLTENGTWAMKRTQQPRLNIIEYLCPGCGAMLDVRTVARNTAEVAS